MGAVTETVAAPDLHARGAHTGEVHYKLHFPGLDRKCDFTAGLRDANSKLKHQLHENVLDQGHTGRLRTVPLRPRPTRGRTRLGGDLIWGPWRPGRGRPCSASWPSWRLTCVLPTTPSSHPHSQVSKAMHRCECNGLRLYPFLPHSSLQKLRQGCDLPGGPHCCVALPSTSLQCPVTLPLPLTGGNKGITDNYHLSGRWAWGSRSEKDPSAASGLRGCTWLPNTLTVLTQRALTLTYSHTRTHSMCSCW